MSDAKRMSDTAVHQLLAAGLASQQAGDTDSAARAYGAALAAAPDDALVLGFVGSFEASQKNSARALQLLRRSVELDPTNESTQFNLGLQLRSAGRLREALQCFERAIALRPASASFHRNRIETLDLVLANQHEMGAACAEALAQAEECLQTNPQRPDWAFLRGLALLRMKREPQALAIFTQLAELAPHRADVHVQLGSCLIALKRFEEARDVLRRAIELDPRSWLARLIFANALVKLYEFEEAITCYRELIADGVEDATVYMNLGSALRDSGEVEAAIACLDHALVLRPGWRDCVLTRAYCLLRIGEYRRGWAEHESRLSDPAVPWVERDFGCPAWNGRAEVRGRTILVWAEQGFGDTIQFSRYATELARLGARVVLEVQAGLVRLIDGLDGVDEVLPFGACKRACDFHCALMSLPHLLGARVSGIPSPAPYLCADADLLAKWAGRMTAGPNVGIAWSGNPGHHQDHRRSIPLAMLRAHLPPGIQWWCIQKQVHEADQRTMAQAAEIAHAPLGDFADTAGLLANLDAVVTVDTSVAHLSAALGRPTLLLLHRPSEWRWQDERLDCPWYDCVRILRQRTRGDWTSVLPDIAPHVQSMLLRSAAIAA